MYKKFINFIYKNKELIINKITITINKNTFYYKLFKTKKKYFQIPLKIIWKIFTVNLLINYSKKFWFVPIYKFGFLENG